MTSENMEQLGNLGTFIVKALNIRRKWLTRVIEFLIILHLNLFVLYKCYDSSIMVHRRIQVLRLRGPHFLGIIIAPPPPPLERFSRIHYKRLSLDFFGISNCTPLPLEFFPDESTHNRTTTLSSNRRPINRRPTNRWKNPKPGYPKPDFPNPDTEVLGNLPKDQPGLGETTYYTEGSFLCVGRAISTIADLGRDSLIYTGGTASLYRTLPNVGWPEQTGHTIHFTYEITHLSFLG